MERVKKQMASKPKMPNVERKPETTKKLVKLWQQLPEDRKSVLRKVMRTPCAWCQDEFKLPAVGRSHGLCDHHAISMGMKPSGKNNAMYMGLLSDYERRLLKFIFSIVYRNEKRAKDYKAFDPMIEEGDLDCSVCKKIMKKDVIDGPHNTSGICPDCKEKVRAWGKTAGEKMRPKSGTFGS